MPPQNQAPLDKLKQQLAQLDQLVADGVLSGDAARKSRDELEAQVLAAVLGPADPAGAAQPQPQRLPRKLSLGVSAFVLVAGVAAYGVAGNHAGWMVGPGEAAPAAAAAAAGQADQAAQIETMIQRLVERLQTNPDDAEGWSILARTYSAQGRYADALPAFKRVLELRPKDAQALADYADGLAVVNNRSLEGEPEKFIAQALSIDPKNIKALSLAGTVSFNRGDFVAAAGLWERAVKGSEPGGDFTRQLQGALDEARKRAGLPPLAGAAADAANVSASAPAPTPAAAAAGATVSGRVTLGAAARGQVGPDDTVFIFARAPSGSRMPLALLRLRVADLPADFKLDDTLAMSPAAKLSSAQQVVVGARVSRSGNAMPQAGDWEVISAPVALGAQGLNLEIAKPVQ